MPVRAGRERGSPGLFFHRSADWQRTHRLAAMNCDFARRPFPPEMCQRKHRDCPEPLRAERAKSRCPVKLAKINLQRHESDVLERQARHDFLRRIWKK